MIFLPHTPKGTTYGSSLPKSAHYLQEWNISGKTGTHIDGITRHGYVTEDIFCMVELGSSGFTVVRYGIENFDFIIMAPNPNLANWGLLVYCYCRLFWIYKEETRKLTEKWRKWCWCDLCIDRYAADLRSSPPLQPPQPPPSTTSPSATSISHPSLSQLLRETLLLNVSILLQWQWEACVLSVRM